MTDILQVSPLLKQYSLDVSNHQTSAKLLKNILQRNIQQKQNMIKLVDECPLVVKKHFGYTSSNKKYLHIIMKSEIEFDQQNLEIVENFIGGSRSHEETDDESDNDEDIDKDYNRKKCVEDDDDDNSEGDDDKVNKGEEGYDDDNSEGDDRVDEEASYDDDNNHASVCDDYMDIDI